jgi:hypothetical protein
MGAMITAVILADDDIEALGATLASLVPALARGVLRDAVVVDGSSGKDVAIIADAAGTTYQRIGEGRDPWRLGAELGRGHWFLLLESGDVPDPAWIAEAERFLLTAGPPGTGALRAAALRRPGRGIVGVAHRLTGQMWWRFRAAPGVLCPRAALTGTAPARLRLERLRAGLLRVASKR